MRKVDLRLNEQEKYKVIKKLVETSGNKKNAAIKLGCTIRTINRLIASYRKEGKSAFVHGNRNRKPVTTYSAEVKKEIIKLYKTTYEGANLKHFSELLENHEHLVVSSKTIRYWLLEENIVSPKARRKTRKKLKDKLEKEKKVATSKKAHNVAEEKLNSLVSDFEAHPRRPRCAYMGELIQMDASPHIWFNNMITHLHLAIDDASGAIVGGYFDRQETLKGYHHVLYQILTNHGIPAKFICDRRTIFEYKKKNAPLDNEDTFTQFSYACHQLGIELQTSSVPQAKGRIERLNGTLQSRLVIELRLAGITSIEAANLFLNHYIKEYNKQFALQLNSTKTVFEKQPSESQINQILAVISNRKIDSGHSIRYKNKVYIPQRENAKRAYFSKGTKALIIEAFDGHLYANISDQLFTLEEIPEHEQFSKNFDPVPEKPKQKKIYIPPMSHPWKQASFFKHLQKQKHRNDGANV